MAEIDIIRELHCYEKIFNHILMTVKECEKICKDTFVKDQLIKVQQEIEDISTGDEYKTYSYLTADEKTVVLLLTYIMDREISKELGKMDSDIFYESLDWLLTIKGINVTLSDEEINERVAEIFRTINEEEDSEVI